MSTQWHENPVAEGATPAPMIESNPLLGDPPALRERLERDGYLLFRQIVDASQLRRLRTRILEELAEIGWVLGGDQLQDARAVGLPQREGEAGYFEALDRVVALEPLYALAHEPGLMAVMRQVLGETAFPHPLSITRLVFPNNEEITTPPHQDYRNNQGTPRLTAAWIPLADCSMAQGGLAVLRGSHRAGLLPLQYHLGPGNRAAVLGDDVAKLPWVSTDFRQGDVLLFPALTVHRALPNLDPQSMRLSVDFRYQVEGEALTPGCLQPHFARTSWEDIYRDWSSDEYKYYWRDKSYLTVPWDETLHYLPDEHLKQAIREGRAYDKKRLERYRNHPLR